MGPPCGRPEEVGTHAGVQARDAPAPEGPRGDCTPLVGVLPSIVASRRGATHISPSRLLANLLFAFCGPSNG